MSIGLWDWTKENRKLRVLLKQIEPIKQTRDNESGHSYFFSLPVPDNRIYNFLIGKLPENNILNGYKRTVSESSLVCLPINQKGQGYSFFINDAKEDLATSPLSTIIGYVGNIELLPRAIEIEYGLKPIESMGKVKN